MNAKLIVDGKEFDIEILDPELKELVVQSQQKNSTGYERVGPTSLYWFVDGCGRIFSDIDYNDISDYDSYDRANYYSNSVVAENNARADTLMRHIRKFAVEHRNKEFDWDNVYEHKWTIIWSYCEKNPLTACPYSTHKSLFAPYFDSREAAELAINTFKDELTWYFTEYKDSL